MKRVIHKYLTNIYFVKGKHIHRYTETRRVHQVNLCKDLFKVFGFTKEELKWVVKSWVKKQNKGFDFNNYWSPNKLDYLAYSIDAALISSNLIRVEPFRQPNGWLNHMDFVYAPYIPVQNINMDFRIGPTGAQFERDVNRIAEYYNAPIIEESRYANRRIYEDYPHTFSVRYEQPNFFN